MAVGITRVLAILTMLQCALGVGEPIDMATQDILQQQEEQEGREMTRLLQEMEQRSQETHRFSHQSVFLAACQHWWFWASTHLLLLLFGIYWLPRQESNEWDSGSQKESSSSKEEERRDDGWDDDVLEGKVDSCDTGSHVLSLDEVGTLSSTTC